MTEGKQDLSVFLVDDEFLARERIKRLLNESPYRLVGEAENGEDAVKQITTEKPDVVLLDIRMPGMDGLKVASIICQLDPRPAIIFCTAYDEYAIDAFNYHAAAYLLKPVRQEQLIKALDGATSLSQAQIANLEERIHKEPDMFVAQTWQGLERIPLENVYYFQADHKYVTIHHAGGETVTDHSLKDIEGKLGSKVFRSHRNTVVMLDKVTSLHKDSESHHYFVLDNDNKVSISRRLVGQARALLEQLQ